MIGITAECFRLVNTLFSYACKRREVGVYDFNEILTSFDRDVLRIIESENLPSRNNFAKRFTKLVREFIETDPRYQSKNDSFYMQKG